MRSFFVAVVVLGLACGSGEPAPSTPVTAAPAPAAAAPAPPVAAPAPGPVAGGCASRCADRRVADAWSSELIAAECAAECGEGGGFVEVAEEDPKSWVVDGTLDVVDVGWDRPEPPPIYAVHTKSGQTVGLACAVDGGTMGARVWITAQRRLDDLDGMVVLADCITPLNPIAP